MRTLLFLIPWLALPSLGAALQGPAPLDLHWEDPARARIEWKATWEETYKVNVARWNEELNKQARDTGEHGRLLRMRVVRLLGELVRRFPDRRDNARKATLEVAGNLYACNLPSRGNYVLKDLLERSQGDAELAAQLLARILYESRWEEPWGVQEGFEWAEFAAERLVALARAGALPEDHPYVANGWRALAVLRRLRGRFLDAREALDHLASFNGRDEWLATQRADLLFDSGHEAEAFPLYRELYGQNERNYHARERAKEIAQFPPSQPPTFHSGGLIEMKWEAVTTGILPAMAGRVVEILEAPESKTTVLPSHRGRYRSLWAAADSLVRSHPDDETTAIRQAEEAKARALLGRPGWQGGERAVELYRRYPFAHAAHRQLLRRGEERLREGRAGLALRSFRDILNHCRDPRTLTQARLGIRLAEAQHGAVAAGGQAAARPPGLRARTLLAPPAAPWHSEVLATLTPREVRAAVWPNATRLAPCDGGLLLAGPELLALYRDDVRKPAWLRRTSLPTVWHRKLELDDYRRIPVPRPIEPAVADGVVYARWGMDPTRRFLTALAAFDAHTGRMLWSTAGRPEWEGLRPVSDPTVAEGRLYALVVHRGRSAVLPVSPIFLTCVDAASGRLLWKQPLASQHVTLVASNRSRFREYQFDLVHYGNAVAVDGGQVFCSTNMGFVACCDARDGLVLWARAYPRVQLRWNVLSVARRHGARPVVAGRAVVFAPRDRVALFALDRRDGSLLWENLFAPSAEVLGVWGDRLVVRDERRLAAIALPDGRCLWRRYFPGGLAACSRPRGGSVIVATSDKLLRVALDTGRVAEATEARASVRDIAVRGDELVLLTAADVAAGAEARRASSAPAKRTPGPPLATCWDLPRQNPTLLVPPPVAELPGRVLVLSQGVLECLEAKPSGRVLWRCTPRPGWRATAWARGLLVLVYAGHAAALSLADGKLLWERRLGFPIRQWEVAGETMVLGAFDQENHTRRAAAVDLRSGRLLWRRRFEGMGSEWENQFHAIGWDGRVVHFTASLKMYGEGCFDVAVEPRTGKVEAVRPLLPRGVSWPRVAAVAGDWGLLVAPTRFPWGFVLGSEVKALKRTQPLEGYRPERDVAKWMQLYGRWGLVHQYEGYPENRHTLWVVCRGEPDYVLRRHGTGTIRGDYLFQPQESGLRVVHLPSRREVVCRIPVARNEAATVLDYRVEGGKLTVVSGLERGPYRSRYVPYRVRVDVFAGESGRHLAGQLLDDFPYWKFVTRREWRDVVVFRTQVAWGDGVVLLTWPGGVRAFAPRASTGEQPARPAAIAYRAARDRSCDGVLDEWDARAATALPASRGRGRLFLAHDRKALQLALQVPAGSVCPRVGRGAHAAGDFLRLAVTTVEGTFQWLVAADAAHAVRWEGLGSPVPRDAAAAMRHDPAAGTLTWELSLPLDVLVGRRSGDAWRSMGLSLAIRADSPDGQPRTLASWGRGLQSGLVVPELHEPLYLHPLSREEEAAALAIADAAPELPVAWAFFRQSCRARARRGDTSAAVARYADYLRRHPRGYPAERALVELDRLLRTDARTNPCDQIIALGRKAGVDAKVLDLYRRWTRSYLSQWVYIDPKQPPETLMLELSGETTASKRGRTVYWGENPGRSSSARSRYARARAGPLPAGAGWHELRVPLIWLGLHNTPVHRIAFLHSGAAKVFWDRTSVVADGREYVVLEDRQPEGETSGEWRWVASPRKSGTRAHADGRATSPGLHRHGLLFRTPLICHIPSQTTGPVLSQWVYLDPNATPSAVSLVLMSRGSSGRFACSWGEPVKKARYMGPLPPAGGWRQLLLPLAWTPFAGRAIHGIGFGCEGGRAWWDRTAIVRNGRETVVIEDETPAGGSRGGKWLWVSEPVKSGKLAHTSGGKARQGSHGCAYLAQPINQHLFDDPRRVEAVLRANIPRLGPTDAAWEVFTAMLDLRHRTARERLEVLHWFLRSVPDHPKALSVLESVVNAYEDLGDPRPGASAEKLMVQCGLPAAVRYAFRRRFLSGPNTFVLAWRVLGPFPNPNGKGHDEPYPPETEPVDITKSYEVVGGRARWRFQKGAAREIDLARLLKPNEHVVAYAVCWAYSEAELPAVIELGSDDGCKLWVNRKLVLDKPVLRSAAPGQDKVPVVLKKGWNEFLLKVDQATSEWQFFFELLDREGRGLLDRLTTSTIPPPAHR